MRLFMDKCAITHLADIYISKIVVSEQAICSRELVDFDDRKERRPDLEKLGLRCIVEVKKTTEKWGIDVRENGQN